MPDADLLFGRRRRRFRDPLGLRIDDEPSVARDLLTDVSPIGDEAPAAATLLAGETPARAEALRGLDVSKEEIARRTETGGLAELLAETRFRREQEQIAGKPLQFVGTRADLLQQREGAPGLIPFLPGRREREEQDIQQAKQASLLNILKRGREGEITDPKEWKLYLEQLKTDTKDFGGAPKRPAGKPVVLGEGQAAFDPISGEMIAERAAPEETHIGKQGETLVTAEGEQIAVGQTLPGKNIVLPEGSTLVDAKGTVLAVGQKKAARAPTLGTMTPEQFETLKERAVELEAGKTGARQTDRKSYSDAIDEYFRRASTTFGFVVAGKRWAELSVDEQMAQAAKFARAKVETLRQFGLTAEDGAAADNAADDAAIRAALKQARSNLDITEPWAQLTPADRERLESATDDILKEQGLTAKP